MIDIYEYARFFTENKHRTFFINSLTGEYVIDTYKTFDSGTERGEYLARNCFFPPYGPQYLDILKDNFIKKYKKLLVSKGVNLDKPITFSPFRKLLNKLNLMDEWIEFIVPYLSSGFYDFVVRNGLVEKEADEKQYQLIRDLAGYFDDDEFMNFSEHNLFCMEIDEKIYADVHFLGYYGGVKGLSFYINDFDHMFYEAFQSEVPDGGLYTPIMLTNTFTLYFENESREEAIKNPFSKDNTLTSISIAYGTMKRNYLSKSQAILIQLLMKNLISTLERLFNNQRLYMSIDPERDCFLNVKIDGRKTKIEVGEQYTYMYYGFIYFTNYRRLTQVTSVRMVKNKEMSFAVIVFPDYLVDQCDERIVHMPLVGLFVDEETGAIMHMILGGDQEGEPLERLSYEMQKYFIEDSENKKLYQTIYVNEDYEGDFLGNVLPPCFKIVQTPMDLATKEAYQTIIKKYNSTKFDEETDA